MATSSLRTQIILPRALRQEIERVRRLTKESLGEYLRKAAHARLEQEETKMVDYKKLAREVVGSVPKSSWAGTDLNRWQRQLREDRE